MSYSWIFARKGPEPLQEPIEADFFDEDIGDESGEVGPARALVREALQNSLDAQVAPDAPVRVRFLVPTTPLAADRSSRWFDSLWPHLLADGSGLRNVPRRPPACRYLVIEDFNTRGLEGDPEAFRKRDATRGGDFFAFVRATGLSGKSDQQGGRWGVGKTMFNRASTYNTLLAFTARRDGVRLLTGRCVLKTHTVGNVEYHPYGLLGEPRPLDEGGELVLPYRDDEVVGCFRRDFGVERAGESGLTVVIPYRDDAITLARLEVAAIEEYFYPLLSGRLRLVLEDGDGDVVNLDRRTVRERANALGIGSMEPLFGLVEFRNRVVQDPDGLEQAGQLWRVPPARQDGAPNWDRVVADVPAAVRARYLSGDCIAVEVPITVVPANGERAQDTFLVCLRRDLEGRGLPPAVLRDGIRVTHALQRRVRGHSAFVLLVAEQGPLAAMLGDAETPAHEKWAVTPRLRERYRHASATIRFVCAAPKRVLELLGQSGDQPDVIALADLFPRPDAEALAPGAPDGETREEDVIVTDPPPVIEGERFLAIRRVRAGFALEITDIARAPAGTRIEVRVAYDTARGNPFARYHPADFDLRSPDFEFRGRGLRLAERPAGNRLVIVVDGPEPRITVRGFDENRDIVVTARVLDNGGAVVPAAD